MNPRAEQAKTTDAIVWGTFDTTPLADIFAVLALSRQLVGLRFSDDAGDVGTIAVKAGQVVGAEDFRTRTTGPDALKGLVSHPGTAFTVVELPRDGPAMQSVEVIGKLNTLLAEADNDREGDAPRLSLPRAGSSRASDVIMHGDVSDVGFDEILKVLPLSKQHLLVSFIRSGSVVGTLNLMSGQVLAATAGSRQGIEAFNHLCDNHGEEFQVRRLPAPDVSGGLGGIDDLLDGMRQRPRPPSTFAQGTRQSERSIFMQGRFSDFSLDEMIDSLAFCRQTIEVVFCAKDRVLHRVVAKSGRINAVASVQARGVGAVMAAISRDPGVLFRVYRRSDSVARRSIASLRALVSETAVVPDSTGERSAPTSSPDGDTLVASGKENAKARKNNLSGIAARLTQVATDVAEVRAAVDTLRQESIRPELAEALTRISAHHAEFRATLEQSTTSVIQGLRTAIKNQGLGRRERSLLWCILAAQLAGLIALVGIAILIA